MVENRLSLLSVSIEAIGKYSLKVLSNDKGGGGVMNSINRKV
jgi:hypothetical protein